MGCEHSTHVTDGTSPAEVKARRKRLLIEYFEKCDEAAASGQDPPALPRFLFERADEQQHEQGKTRNERIQQLVADGLVNRNNIAGDKLTGAQAPVIPSRPMRDSKRRAIIIVATAWEAEGMAVKQQEDRESFPSTHLSNNGRSCRRRVSFADEVQTEDGNPLVVQDISESPFCGERPTKETAI